MIQPLLTIWLCDKSLRVFRYFQFSNVYYQIPMVHSQPSMNNGFQQKVEQVEVAFRWSKQKNVTHITRLIMTPFELP